MYPHVYIGSLAQDMNETSFAVVVRIASKHLAAFFIPAEVADVFPTEKLEPHVIEELFADPAVFNPRAFVFNAGFAVMVDFASWGNEGFLVGRGGFIMLGSAASKVLSLSRNALV